MLYLIEKAKTACLNSGQRIEDHFVDFHEMVVTGSGAERPVRAQRFTRKDFLPLWSVRGPAPFLEKAERAHAKKRDALKMNAGTPHRKKPLKRRRCWKSCQFSFLARCGPHSRSFLRSVCECTPHRPTPLFSSLHKNNSEYADGQTPPLAITGGGVPFRFCLLNLYYLRF